MIDRVQPLAGPPTCSARHHQDQQLLCADHDPLTYVCVHVLTHDLPRTDVCVDTGNAADSRSPTQSLYARTYPVCVHGVFRVEYDAGSLLAPSLSSSVAFATHIG